MSDVVRHHLRAARRAPTVMIDADGQIVSGSDPFDEDAAIATAESADIVAAARERADHLIREAALESASIRHEAYAEGRHQGEQDGVALARADLADQMALLQRVLGESKAIRDRLLWAAEQEIIELVLSATRTVVGEHARLDPGFTVETVERALERAGSQNVIAIRIHPDRHELLDAHLTEVRGVPPPFEVRADAAVAVGGCVIDTEAGQVDARLDIQLDEVARLLRGALPGADEFGVAA